MRRYSTALLAGSLATVLLAGCENEKAVVPAFAPATALLAKGGPDSSGFATLLTLDRFSAANAVNQAGTIIAGYRGRGRIGSNDVWVVRNP